MNRRARVVSIGTLAARAGGILLVAGFAVAAFAEKGDVNEDGAFNAADALVASQAVLGTGELGAEQAWAADVAPLFGGVDPPGDGEVDAGDLTVLMRGLLYVDDIDLDGLDRSVEDALGLSPFAQDTDGNGTADPDEDGDGDRLTNLDEVALETDPINPSSGPGVADTAWTPYLPDPFYEHDPVTGEPLGPLVLVDISHANEFVDGWLDGRLGPFIKLLSADGYLVEPFDETFAPGLDLSAPDPAHPGFDYWDELTNAAVFVVVDPVDELSKEEAEELLRWTNDYVPDKAILLATERPESVQKLLDTLTLEFSEYRVRQQLPSCPDGGPDCPLGWKTFRQDEEELDDLHRIFSGRDDEIWPPSSPESVSQVSSFLGYGIQSSTPTRKIRPLATFGPNAVVREGGAEVSAEGLWQLAAIRLGRTPDPIVPIRGGS
jgi:hypothetical protein